MWFIIQPSMHIHHRITLLVSFYVWLSVSVSSANIPDLCLRWWKVRKVSKVDFQSKSNSLRTYYVSLHKIYMVRYIPDWTFKAECLISIILRLLINVKVDGGEGGGGGCSLPDKLQRVSSVSCAWASEIPHSGPVLLTGFTHELRSWHGAALGS